MKKETPCVKDMALSYLRGQGFEGLFNSDIECSCDVNDLMPCGQPYDNCEAGYRVVDKSGDYDFLIVREKP